MIVADASPIHCLILTGDISVLQALHGTVLIPVAVRRELPRSDVEPTPSE